MMKDMQLFLVGEDNELRKDLADLLQMSYKVLMIDLESWSSEIRRYDPEIVIFTEGSINPVEMIKDFYQDFPNASVMYVHTQEDFQLLRELTRIGTEDFIILPDEKELLESRLEQLWQKRSVVRESAVASTGFKRGRGQIFAFYSGKGGAGKTLISTAFAQTLKLESTAQVLHIDLNLQFGGAEMYLGIESNRSIIDLKPVINELNEHHIRNISEKENYSKLELLASPMDAEVAEKIDEEFILRLLRACKRSYDFIIIDLPTTVDVKTFTALEESDRIYYVMTLDTPAIRVLKNVEELFKRLGLYTHERLELVVNQVGRDNELTKKDLERFVQLPITAEIRRDIKGIQSMINKGEPLRKEMKEKKMVGPAKDIQKWVSSMLK